jgi:hypothetical protein
MKKVNKYFMVSFKNVPDHPSYTVWYASWSTERPTPEPGMEPPFTIGVTTDAQLPPGATLLATSTKDPPPPPPAMTTGTPSEYAAAFNKWIELTKEE